MQMRPIKPFWRIIFFWFFLTKQRLIGIWLRIQIIRFPLVKFLKCLKLKLTSILVGAWILLSCLALLLLISVCFIGIWVIQISIVSLLSFLICIFKRFPTVALLFNKSALYLFISSTMFSCILFLIKGCFNCWSRGRSRSVFGKPSLVVLFILWVRFKLIRRSIIIPLRRNSLRRNFFVAVVGVNIIKRVFIIVSSFPRMLRNVSAKIAGLLIWIVCWILIGISISFFFGLEIIRVVIFELSVIELFVIKFLTPIVVFLYGTLGLIIVIRIGIESLDGWSFSPLFLSLPKVGLGIVGVKL